MGDHQNEKQSDENSGVWFCTTSVSEIRKFRGAKIKMQTFSFERKLEVLGMVMYFSFIGGLNQFWFWHVQNETRFEISTFPCIMKLLSYSEYSYFFKKHPF